MKIKTDEKLGRFLQAARECEKTSVVLVEPPLIVGPKWNLDEDDEPTTLNFSCVGCFEPIRVLRHKCPMCNWPACSPDCSGLINPELHDIECGLLRIGKGPADRTDVRAIKEYYRSDALLALKILLLQRKNPKKFKLMMTMEANEKERLLTYNYKEAEERIMYLETNFLKPLKLAEDAAHQVIIERKDKKTLHKIYGIIETNAMYINLSTGTEICGIYLTGCLLEHSCTPNCGYNFDMKNGFKLVVEAARDIKKEEHLSTMYSHVLWSTQLRQQHLKDSKYFTCKCLRCSDPSELGTNFSTLRCIGAEDGPCNGLQLPTDPLSDKSEWACNKCPIKISNEQVMFLTGKMGEEIDKTLANTPNAKESEELIEKLKPFLHETHYHMFALKHSLIQIYGTHISSQTKSLSDTVLENKLKMCNDLIGIVNTLDPYCIRLPIYTGIIYYEKHNALVELNRRHADKYELKDAKASLVKAKKILVNEVDTMQGKQLNDKITQGIKKLSA